SILAHELADWEQTAIKTGMKKGAAQNAQKSGHGQKSRTPADGTPMANSPQPAKSRLKTPSELIEPPADFSMDDSQWAEAQEE
ncbi:MAG: hypothetical protein V1822_01170, partial [Candidatus Micrarchaeota archaeon]